MTKEETISQTRDEILSLLSDVRRPGMDKVVWYLENSDYFRARCNTHHRFAGGLSVHSLGVYKEFKKLDTNISEDSIRIVSLLHDISKAHLQGYNHIGKHRHGYRSVKLLSALGLKFEIGEYDAIEKHMHRIKDVPKSQTYDQRDMLRHYMHQCDHRDAATYPDNYDSYTPDERKPLWYQIDTLLYSTRRRGVEIVIDHLHKKDSQGKNDIFFKAPASVSYHNNTLGGLAKHSFQVYHEAMAMYEKLITSSVELSFGEDSIILCSLLHDVCKMDEYVMKDGRSEHTKHYNGGNPHGIKSERCLRRWHLALTDAEREAIIWHMGKYTKDATREYGTTYAEVAAVSPLVMLIHEADSLSAKKK